MRRIKAKVGCVVRSFWRASASPSLFKRFKVFRAAMKEKRINCKRTTDCKSKNRYCIIYLLVEKTGTLKYTSKRLTKRVSVLDITALQCFTAHSGRFGGKWASFAEIVSTWRIPGKYARHWIALSPSSETRSRRIPKPGWPTTGPRWPVSWLVRLVLSSPGRRFERRDNWIPVVVGDRGAKVERPRGCQTVIDKFVRGARFAKGKLRIDTCIRRFHDIAQKLRRSLGRAFKR